jgi:hypothetical protein
LVAYSDDRVGEPGALLGGVDLLMDGGQRIPAPLGIVVFDRFAQALDVWADHSWERDQQREIEGGEVQQFLGEVIERAVGEAVELFDCLTGELGDVRVGELLH